MVGVGVELFFVVVVDVFFVGVVGVVGLEVGVEVGVVDFFGEVVGDVGVGLVGGGVLKYMYLSSW